MPKAKASERAPETEGKWPADAVEQRSISELPWAHVIAAALNIAAGALNYGALGMITAVQREADDDDVDAKEDAHDLEVARLCLAELAASPELLVEGDALRDRLAKIGAKETTR